VVLNSWGEKGHGGLCKKKKLQNKQKKRLFNTREKKNYKKKVVYKLKK